jgi:hypothetical protein
VKHPRSALSARARRLGRRIVGAAGPQPELRGAIARLQRTHGEPVVFAVMRKLADTPFRVPIQDVHSGAISAPEIRSDYPNALG